MKTMNLLLALCLALGALAATACDSGGIDGDGDADADGDGDADADGDADGDGDGDGDADVDADADADADADSEGDGGADADVDADADADEEVDGDVDGGVVEACLNDADLAILAATDLRSVASTCLLDCFGSADLGACVTGCITTETGLSDACAGCFGDVATCGAAHCLATCMTDPSGPACMECIGTACGPDFEACSGVPLAPDPGACTNADDLAVIRSIDLGTTVTTCGIGCASDTDPPGCTADCISATGLSDPCTVCHVDLFTCGSTSCFASCAADPASVDCHDCMSLSCYPAYEDCSGLPAPAPPPPPADQCMGAADQAILATVDMREIMADCAGPCLSAPDPMTCIDTCVATETRLSEGCLGCYSTFTFCGMSSCAADCAPDPATDPCLACVIAACGAGFETCAGMPF